MSVKIKPSQIVFGLGAILFLLFILNFTGYFFKFVVKYRHIHNFTLFNFDMEANIPTYFSSFILLFSGILLGFIAYWTKKQKNRYVLHWTFLSIVFIYLSLDETAQIHELLNTPLQIMFSLKGIFYFASVIPGVIVTAIFIISYFRFWINLPFRTKIFFAIALICYVGGAIGMELIGGRHTYLYGQENLAYGLITTIEESFEMLGIVLFIHALLNYIKTYIPEIRFELV